MKVLAEAGFHEARMEDIAEEAGLSKGTLYWYFDSKDEIILTILEQIFDVELGDLEVLLQQEGSVRERLLAFVRDFGRELEEMSAFLPIAYEFYAAAGRREPVRTFLRKYFRSYRETLAQLVKRGIERGEFRAVDAEEVAISIVALYEGISLLWVTDPEAVSLSGQLEASLRLLLEGLVTNNSEPEVT